MMTGEDIHEVQYQFLSPGYTRLASDAVYSLVFFLSLHLLVHETLKCEEEPLFL